MAIQIPLYEASQPRMEQGGGSLLSPQGFAQRDVNAETAMYQTRQAANTQLRETGLRLFGGIMQTIADVRLSNALSRQQTMSEGLNVESVLDAMRGDLDENGNTIMDPNLVDWSNYTMADVQAIAQGVSPEYQSAIFRAAQDQIIQAESSRVGILASGELRTRMTDAFSRAEADAVVRSVQETVAHLKAQGIANIETQIQNGNAEGAQEAVDFLVSRQLMGSREAGVWLQSIEAQAAPNLAVNTLSSIMASRGEAESSRVLDAIMTGDMDALVAEVGEETASVIGNMTEPQRALVQNNYEQYASDHLRRQNRMWAAEVGTVAANTEGLIADQNLSWQYYRQVENQFQQSGNTSPAATNHLEYIRGVLTAMADNADDSNRFAAEQALMAELARLETDVMTGRATWDNLVLETIRNATYSVTMDDGSVQTFPVVANENELLVESRRRREAMNEFRLNEEQLVGIAEGIAAMIPRDEPRREQIESVLMARAQEIWNDAGNDIGRIASLRDGEMAEHLYATLVQQLHGGSMPGFRDFVTMDYGAQGSIQQALNLGNLNRRLGELSAREVEIERGLDIQLTPMAMYAAEPQRFIEAGQSIAFALESEYGVPPRRLATSLSQVQPYAVYSTQDLGIDITGGQFPRDILNRFTFEEDGVRSVGITYMHSGRRTGEPILSIYDREQDAFVPVNTVQSIRLREILEGRTLAPSGTGSASTTVGGGVQVGTQPDGVSGPTIPMYGAQVPLGNPR